MDTNVNRGNFIMSQGAQVTYTLLIFFSLKTMTHQPTQLLSWVELGPVGVCVIGLSPVHTEKIMKGSS